LYHPLNGEKREIKTPLERDVFFWLRGRVCIILSMGKNEN